MIRIVDNTPVNYNEELFSKKNKFNLRKIKAPLIVAGIIFTLAATSLASKSKEPSYEELCSIIQELPENEQQILTEYLSAYQLYEASKSSKDTNTKIAARKELIKESEKVEIKLKRILKDKIEEATLKDIPDYLKGYNNVSFHERDGERVTVIESIDDQNIINNDRLPKEMDKLIDNFYTLENYSGDGTSSKWDKEIDDYNKNTIEMIKQAGNICSKDYDFDGWTWTSHTCESMQK